MQTLSVPPTDADRVLGRLDAPIVIVEYGDYDCPHTRRAHPVLKQLMAESPSAIALVFRVFPLRHIHQNAQKLAELMYAIDDRAAFWVAHERLMAQRHMSVLVANAELSGLELSIEQLATRSAQAALTVQTDVDRGLRDGVHSTPSFFFNGAPHDGHYDVDTLRRQIAAAPPRLG